MQEMFKQRQSLVTVHSRDILFLMFILMSVADLCARHVILRLAHHVIVRLWLICELTMLSLGWLTMLSLGYG